MITLNFEKITLSDFDKESANQEAEYVSRIFSSIYGNIVFENVRRITVHLVDHPTTLVVIPPMKEVKVCQLKHQIDIQEYISLKSKKNRYLFLLEHLTNAILMASEKYNWPKEKILETKEMIIKLSFKREVKLLKGKKSPNRKLSASVVIEMEENKNAIFLKISRSDLLVKKHLFNLSLLEDSPSIFMNKIKWISNNELRIINKKEEISFCYDIPSNNVELIIEPKKHSRSYLEEELKLLDANTSKEEYLMISKKRLADLGFDYDAHFRS